MAKVDSCVHTKDCVEVRHLARQLANERKARTKLERLIDAAHLGGLCERHDVAPNDKCPECKLEVFWSDRKKAAWRKTMTPLLDMAEQMSKGFPVHTEPWCAVRDTARALLDGKVHKRPRES